MDSFLRDLKHSKTSLDPIFFYESINSCSCTYLISRKARCSLMFLALWEASSGTSSWEKFAGSRKAFVLIGWVPISSSLFACWGKKWLASDCYSLDIKELVLFKWSSAMLSLSSSSMFLNSLNLTIIIEFCSLLSLGADESWLKALLSKPTRFLFWRPATLSEALGLLGLIFDYVGAVLFFWFSSDVVSCLKSSIDFRLTKNERACVLTFSSSKMLGECYSLVREPALFASCFSLIVGSILTLSIF